MSPGGVSSFIPSPGSASNQSGTNGPQSPYNMGPDTPPPAYSPQQQQPEGGGQQNLEQQNNVRQRFIMA